ncbi:MAG: hypothetical protein IPK64_18100 [bacterium]|nr:hypothetical protein [bacterium]
MRNLYLCVLATMLLAVCCQSAVGAPPPRFAVYLQQNAVAVGDPIMTDEDIVEYCWNRHWIRLTDDAAKRWNSAPGNHRSRRGSRFVVMVDGQSCYEGTIWSFASSSSQVPSGPVIFDMALNGVVMTTLHAERPDTGADSSCNAEVRTVFAELGKLNDECAEEW